MAKQVFKAEKIDQSELTESVRSLVKNLQRFDLIECEERRQDVPDLFETKLYIVDSWSNENGTNSYISVYTFKNFRKSRRIRLVDIKYAWVICHNFRHNHELFNLVKSLVLKNEALEEWCSRVVDLVNDLQSLPLWSKRG